jgi:pimeloyl-ACP methyl ester carboxylesterase
MSMRERAGVGEGAVLERDIAGLAVADYRCPDPRPGPTMVLLPSLGLSRRSWAGPAVLLAQRYRCLAVDPSGQGRSEPPTHFMTVPDLAEAVGKVVESEAGEPVMVVGNSMGASVAAQLAADRPDLVSAAVLVGAFAADEPARRQWLHARSAAFLHPYGALRPMDAAFAETVFGIYNADWHRLMLEDHVDAHPVLASSMWALYSFHLAAALERLGQPVLSVFGENDQLLAVSAPVIREHVKDLTEAVVRGGSHLTTIDQPAALARCIRDWTDSLAGLA